MNPAVFSLLKKSMNICVNFIVVSSEKINKQRTLIAHCLLNKFQYQIVILCLKIYFLLLSSSSVFCLNPGFCFTISRRNSSG